MPKQHAGNKREPMGGKTDRMRPNKSPNPIGPSSGVPAPKKG